MSDQDKDIARALAAAFAALPDHKKEYLIGYAEGVAAMAEKEQPQLPPQEQIAGGEEYAR